MLRLLLLTFTLSGSFATTTVADCIMQTEVSLQPREDLSLMLFEPQSISAVSSRVSWKHEYTFPEIRTENAFSRELVCADKGGRLVEAELEDKSQNVQVRFVAMPDYAPIEWNDVPAPDLSEETPGLGGMVPIELGPVSGLVKGDSAVKSVATGRSLAPPQHTASVKVSIPVP
jgi:hypothetical protein